jgi:cbb3-type cytochrome c oxidase subunit III
LSWRRTAALLALVALIVLCALALGCGGNSGPSGATRATGASLYEELCALCHGDQGEGGAVEGAPALNNQDFLAAVSDDFLFETIAEGRPGTRMSGWSAGRGGPLEDEDVEAVVEYIQSWRTVPRVALGDDPIQGSAERGAELFATSCASCHGADGEGGTGPSLANPGFLRAASDPFIRHTIATGRQGTAMGAYRDVLTAQQLDDLTAFIRAWQRP